MCRFYACEDHYNPLTYDDNYNQSGTMPGERVSTDHSPIPKATNTLRGKYVTLSELTPDDAPAIWTALGMPDNKALWDYLPVEPPRDVDDMRQAFESWHQARGFILYTIRTDKRALSPRQGTQQSESKHDDVVGLIAYLNIEPSNRAVEIGAVVYGPALARTAAATEVSYLMLRHVFGDDEHALAPHYRRVVWKCNSLNAASRRAAERLGFVFEGCFRKHMIVKGCNRDSFWLSIVDDEWPVVKAGLEAWLAEENFDGEGRQRETLEAMREKTKASQ